YKTDHAVTTSRTSRRGRHDLPGHGHAFSPRTSGDVDRVVRDGIRWDTFAALLEDWDGRRIRLTYDRGREPMAMPAGGRATGRRWGWACDPRRPESPGLG